MHLFALCKMAGGQPEIDFEKTPVHGWGLAGVKENFGVYLFSGSAEQLAAIAALPQIVVITTATNDKDKRWPELDEKPNAAARTKLNAGLSAKKLKVAGASATYRQIVTELYAGMNPVFDLAGFDLDAPSKAKKEASGW